MFFPPSIGLLILKEEKIFRTVYIYLALVLISNLITNMYLMFAKNYLVYQFTPSFFVKYSIFNIFVISCVYLLIMHTEINVERKNEK